MYEETIDKFAGLAKKKSDTISVSPLKFIIGSLMAGAYVGLGIILIFSVGANIDPGFQKLVMGVSFGIALTLVVFAGSELFTGHTMYMVFGWLKGMTNGYDLAKVWSVSWSFNLIGSFLLALIFAIGGGGVLINEANTLLLKIAEYKMNSPIYALVARATLCNWLVCLALWMAARTTSDSAKCIVIFWCLFGFIASGFEHSVANMTLLSISLLGEHSELISISGMFYNLFWVTFGNIIGGSVFMGLGYWYASDCKREGIVTRDEQGALINTDA